MALDIHSPMDLVYECFVKLGLRYICVLRDGKYAGMVRISLLCSIELGVAVKADFKETDTQEDFCQVYERAGEARPYVSQGLWQETEIETQEHYTPQRQAASAEKRVRQLFICIRALGHCIRRHKLSGKIEYYSLLPKQSRHAWLSGFPVSRQVLKICVESEQITTEMPSTAD